MSSILRGCSNPAILRQHRQWHFRKSLNRDPFVILEEQPVSCSQQSPNRTVSMLAVNLAEPIFDLYSKLRVLIAFRDEYNTKSCPPDPPVTIP